jgi:hypothetical protein
MDDDNCKPITDEEWVKDRGKKTAIGQANAILEERREKLLEEARKEMQENQVVI